jgi:hypothetical protein
LPGVGDAFAIEAAMKLLILGAGSIAREVALAMCCVPLDASECLEVKIAGRDRYRAEWIAMLGNSRSRTFSRNIRYAAADIAWERRESLASVIDGFDPGIVLHAASLQSRWTLKADGAWSRMISAGGYGLTVALQAVLHRRAWECIVLSGKTPIFVNACYPDLVNALGAAVGVRTYCGVGNIGMLAEYYALHLEVPNCRMRVLAGHVDVEESTKAPELRRFFPRVWIDGVELPEEGISGIPALTGDVTLNAFNAGTIANVLSALLGCRPLPLVHLPGAHGMIGGMPMSFDGKYLCPALPPGVSEEEALGWNRTRAEMDGASIERERVFFSPKARAALAPYSAELSKGFLVTDLIDAAAEFEQLRGKMESAAAR